LLTIFSQLYQNSITFEVCSTVSHIDTKLRQFLNSSFSVFYFARTDTGTTYIIKTIIRFARHSWRADRLTVYLIAVLSSCTSHCY